MDDEAYYWSSTEYDSYGAWTLGMNIGGRGAYDKYDDSYDVRPVRFLGVREAM